MKYIKGTSASNLGKAGASAPCPSVLLALLFTFAVRLPFHSALWLVRFGIGFGVARDTAVLGRAGRSRRLSFGTLNGLR